MNFWRKKLMSPWSRHGGACTISAGEEAAHLQVIVVEEIMCAIYRTPQVGEFSQALICRISLEAKKVLFQKYLSITFPVQIGLKWNRQSSSTSSPQLPAICFVHLWELGALSVLRVAFQNRSIVRNSKRPSCLLKAGDHKLWILIIFALSWNFLVTIYFYFSAIF